MRRDSIDAWVDGYVRAWRQEGTSTLAEIFTPDITYLPSPWASAIEGLDALREFWEAERDGPDEVFRLDFDVVALDGPVAVLRVNVDYAVGRRWRDLWIVEMAPDGRCTRFEEWPFALGQPDGH